MLPEFERYGAQFLGISSGVRSGVNGTPTFFIDGERPDESWKLERLRAALEHQAAAKR